MFGLNKPKLPVSPEQQLWIDNSFVRLAGLLGRHRLLRATVALPTSEHFPDPYDCSEESLQNVLRRVAAFMQVEPAEIDVTLFVEGDDLTKGLTPFYFGKTSGASGLYHHNPADQSHISVREDQLKDPMGLVAVLAHEIGHIILLRPGLVDCEEPDMEPLNDLLTVFLGFGIFTANSVFRYERHSDYRSEGWSAKRLGYLSEESFGYALARFAYERDESNPVWVRFLSSNISSYLKRSAAWLSANRAPRLFVGS